MPKWKRKYQSQIIMAGDLLFNHSKLLNKFWPKRFFLSYPGLQLSFMVPLKSNQPFQDLKVREENMEATDASQIPVFDSLEKILSEGEKFVTVVRVLVKCPWDLDPCEIEVEEALEKKWS